MPQDLLQIALEHHRAGRLRQAEAGYRALLEAVPDDADAAHWLGVLLFQAGAAGEAVPLLERAAELRPSDAAFQHNLAQAYLGNGRPGDAVAAFEGAATLEPGRAETLVGLGLALMAQNTAGDGAAAADAFRRANTAGLDTAELHHDLGMALLLAGQTDEAVGAFRAALLRNPDYASAHYHMASAYRTRGELREVRKSLLKALEVEPGLARAWHDLGVLDAEAGKPGVAAGLFRKAVAAKSDFAAGWVGLAKVLEQLGRRDEAAAAAAQAARLVQAERTAGQGAANAAAAGRAGPGTESAAVQELERKLRGEDALQLHFALASRLNVFSPTQLPVESLRNLFDRYADHFDHSLRDQLKYQAPELIAQAVEAVRVADPGLAGRRMDVLDLGCGTGLCGMFLRPVAGTLVGVDLSPPMIEQARARGIYDRLEVGDMLETMKKAPRSFDLMVSADVFIYVGDLAPTFEAARLSLRPGGLFAFSAEAGGGDRFHLGMATRRYTHSEPYLRRMAAMYGFEWVSLSHAPLRVERGKPVPGYIVVLRLLPE